MAALKNFARSQIENIIYIKDYHDASLEPVDFQHGVAVVITFPEIP